MTLYTEIREEEKRIALLQKEIQHLQNNGFSIEGKRPILEEEARNLLREKYHKVVGYIPRITSCGLSDYVDELLTQRSWRLKYSKEKRRKYNQLIEELAEAVPSASRLKRGSFLSLQEVEGLTLFGGVSTAFLIFIVDCFSYLCSGEVFNDKIPWTYLYGGIGTFGFLLGGAISYDSDRTGFKQNVSRVRGEAGHIDKTLGYEKGTH